jgi:proteasome accessory factor B
MDRTERLLDLVALLLDAQGPVSWGGIREAFPEEYSGSQEAAERKFERDKAELLELGLPITWTPATDDHLEGYVIDKSAYYLPEVALAPAELAVLYAAGSAVLASGAFPGRDDLAHALRKISFFADGQLPPPKVRLELSELTGSRELPARLEALWRAINGKKWVDLDYFSPRSADVTHRRVDPYGLALRRGVWTLVGYCHLRQAVRVFHVHRVRALTVNELKPKSADFEVPRAFTLDEWVAAWPWQHRFHAPLEVTVELRGELAPLASSLFGVTATVAGERSTFTLSVTDLEGLVGYVLSQGPDARLVAPEPAVQALRAAATRVLDAHREPAP